MREALVAVDECARQSCPGCELGEKFDGDSHKTNCGEGPAICHIEPMGEVVYFKVRPALLPDSCWLKRHDAETRRKAFEEVYKKMGDTPANVYFNFVDWVRSQIKALELQGVDKE